jgi:hypothetical protein
MLRMDDRLFPRWPPDPLEEMVACPRCSVRHRSGDFRNGVCGWCNEDIERRRGGGSDG